MTFRELLMPKLLSIKEVAEKFRQAMDENKPISLASVGDGEVYFLAHKVLPAFDNFYESAFKDLFYQHIQAYRDEVLNGILAVDILEVNSCFSPTNDLFEHHSMSMDRHFCDASIGRGLHFTGLLYEILKKKRVFLVGNGMGQIMQPLLEKYEIELVGYTNVDNFPDLPRVKESLSKVDFDLALISASTPALILAPWITKSLGKCSLDFGSTVSLVNDTMELIGAQRTDYNVFIPEAKTDFIDYPE